MNRLKFVQYLKKSGCDLLREGSRHSIFYNPDTNQVSSVPRHSEINDFLAKKIKKDLGLR